MSSCMLRDINKTQALLQRIQGAIQLPVLLHHILCPAPHVTMHGQDFQVAVRAPCSIQILPVWQPGIGMESCMLVILHVTSGALKSDNRFRKAYRSVASCQQAQHCPLCSHIRQLFRNTQGLHFRPFKSGSGYACVRSSLHFQSHNFALHALYHATVVETVSRRDHESRHRDSGTCLAARIASSGSC